jgi:DNA-cytosine methyltransferase
MTQMTAVSLFAGIGGFDLALERNGVKVVASVEIDKHAQGVLRKQFPNSQILGDIQEVSGEQLISAGFTPQHGVIVGGFPCQDLSVAGKRAGLAGARSGLFWEICRLLDETQARYFILENVPGLLTSSGGRDMGVVIGALAERGYSIAWRVLDAQYFGVPQRRRRIFIVGCLGDEWRAPAEILDLTEGSAGDTPPSRAQKQNATDQTDDSSRAGGRAGNFELYDFPTESVSPSLNASRAHDTMTWWDGSETAQSLTATSNEQRMPDKGRMQIVFYGNRVDDIRVQDDQINTLQARMGTGGNNMPMVATAYSIREDAKADTFSATESDTSVALQAHQPSVQSHHAQMFVAQTFDTYNQTTSDTAQTLRSGTDMDKMGVVHMEQPMVMQDREGKPGGGKGPLVSDTSFLLRTSNFQTLFTSTVRRLTPTECERLQGFPDGWTEGQADSHRYKQLGNAVAVPVVEWLISRLVSRG